MIISNFECCFSILQIHFMQNLATYHTFSPFMKPFIGITRFLYFSSTCSVIFYSTRFPTPCNTNGVKFGGKAVVPFLILYLTTYIQIY